MGEYDKSTLSPLPPMQTPDSESRSGMGPQFKMGPVSMHDMELLLNVIGHHMDQELRGKIIREVPLAYNRWMGWRVVEVVHQDGRVVR